MIRRLNYTGRRKIPRSRVTIRLLRSKGDTFAFTMETDISESEFPPESKVFVEAYNATSYMRFDFGTVADIKSPADTLLKDITASALPKFRVKIVERTLQRGRLLGVADKLIPLQAMDEASNKQSLLAVDFRDLGDQVWRLDLLDWPVLELNNRIDNLGEIARSSHAFLGLVYPEIVREILHEIVLEQGITDPDFDDSEWTALWLRFICGMPGVERPPEGRSEEERLVQMEWIEKAVDVFCRDKQVRIKFQLVADQGAV